MRLGKGSLVLIVALAVALVWALRPDTPRAARPIAGTTIVAFGDSLVEGRGATPGQDFVSVLSARLGRPIINAGRSGDTTGAALARLESDVLARNPRVVIVLLGGNDFLRRVPREQTFANLASIVERIRARGAAVVLVGLSVGLFTDSYGDEFEALARRNDAALVPDILGGIIGDAARMADSIHPNDTGYRIMADRVEPVVRDLVAAD
jgi:lysophospholipase L1-like esterase